MKKKKKTKSKNVYCFRCGIGKWEAWNKRIPCNVYGKAYKSHMWKCDGQELTDKDVKTEKVDVSQPMEAIKKASILKRVWEKFWK